MRSASLVLALSAWAALTRAGRAEDVAQLPVPDGPPVPAAVNTHGGPGGCATCEHADLHGGETHTNCGDVRRPCLSRILQWATYRPLPCSGCGSCGSCGSCHSWRFWQGCGSCKECLPCCTPPLYAFFLHRCPCNAHIYHYPVVYKTWDGHWPPAYAGPGDQAVIYTDTARFNP